jgi:hypothetical protein
MVQSLMYVALVWQLSGALVALKPTNLERFACA